MFDTEDPQSQQVPYISTSPTTSCQFVNTIKSFLEENNVTIVGPFSMEVQQTEESGTSLPKLVLLLKGDIRSEVQPRPYQTVSSSGNTSPSSVDSNSRWEEVGRNNYIPVLGNDGTPDLNYPQANLGSPSIDSIFSSNSPLTANTIGSLESTDLFSPDNYTFLLPSAASDYFPGGAGESSHNNAISSSSSESERRQSQTQSLEHVHFERAVSMDENSSSLLTSLLSSTNNSDFQYIRPNAFMSLNQCSGELSNNDHGGFQVPGTQEIGSSNSGSGSPRPWEFQVPTPSNEESMGSSPPEPLVSFRQEVYSTPQLESDSLDMANSIVGSASRNILREDYIQLLEMELPRWKTHGLWHDTQFLKPTAGTSGYVELEVAYSSVCQLDVRMGDDVIRNRMALIRLHTEYTETYQTWRAQQQNRSSQPTTIGRGDATLIIDAILESIHQGWDTFDHRKRSELRAKFHDRKRYGKRWLLLANALGPSILLLCSSKVANMIRNTTVTVKMLEAIALKVKTDHLDTMSVFQITNPLAGCLFRNDGYTSYDVDNTLRQLRDIRPRLPAAGERRATF